MYRQYQDPYALEDRLADKREEYQTALENGADLDTLFEIESDIHELKEMLNFAWQDDEYNHTN